MVKNITKKKDVFVVNLKWMGDSTIGKRLS